MNTENRTIRSYETYAQGGSAVLDAQTTERSYSREDNRPAEQVEITAALPMPQDFVCSGNFQVTVPEGLHLRPAAMLVATASLFECDILIDCKGAVANAKSILGLLTLNATCGSEVTVSTNGFDSGFALAAIRCLFLSGFAE